MGHHGGRGGHARRSPTRPAGPATWPAVTGRGGGRLLADLPEALPERAAARWTTRRPCDADVAHLMAALPALARALRYGDVRGTDTGGAGRGGRALVVRICAGLPAAVTGLDDDARGGAARPARRGARGASRCSPRPRRRQAARPLAGGAGRAGRPAATCTGCWPGGWSGCWSTPGADRGGGGPAAAPRAVGRRRRAAGQGGLGRGLPGRRRPAAGARPRPARRCSTAGCAGLGRAGVHRRAAAAAADVRRVLGRRERRRPRRAAVRRQRRPAGAAPTAAEPATPTRDRGRAAHGRGHPAAAPR